MTEGKGGLFARFGFRKGTAAAEPVVSTPPSDTTPVHLEKEQQRPSLERIGKLMTPDTGPELARALYGLSRYLLAESPAASSIEREGELWERATEGGKHPEKAIGQVGAFQDSVNKLSRLGPGEGEVWYVPGGAGLYDYSLKIKMEK